MPGEAPSKFNYRSRWFRVAVIALLVVVCSVLWLGLELFVFPKFNRTPDVIQALERRLLAPQHAKVFVLNWRLVESWPFTEADYAALKAQQVTDPTTVDHLLKTLVSDFHAGNLYSNHPTLISSYLLRIEGADNDWYYLFVEEMQHSGYEAYVSVLALPRCTTNPNGGRQYTNPRSQVFLTDRETIRRRQIGWVIPEL